MSFAMRHSACLVLLLSICGCGPAAHGPAPAPLGDYTAFHDPQKIAIREYDGDAMEPFITPDGRFLLFNNRNDPREDTDLQVAERIDDLTFHYLGPVAGANSKSLDAVPSVDRDNRLYFISTRSYERDYSTLYRARFRDGVVSDVEPVPGVSEHKPGHVIFDAGISADGNTLFLVDGIFDGGTVPTAATIAIALRDGDTFRRLPAGDAQLNNVNAAQALDYAPAVSMDLLELFFTRYTPVRSSPEPVILRAARNRTDEPFGPPLRVAAIAGYAEAPALSPDGRALYYAKRDGGRFVIYRVVR